MQQYDDEQHEQLRDGAGYATHADDGGGKQVRIVPISEGERTIGHRENGDEAPAIWDRDVLEQAVNENLLSDPRRADRPKSLIVKGSSGRNPHHSFHEQVDPDDILGRIDRWEYEPGTGPVGYATLADEEIANRIELGLLEVSGDWLRRLGEYDEERGGKPVTEIVGLPRVTVLERGAAQGASIEIAPETAEALGYNPDADDPDVGAAVLDPDTEETGEQHQTDGDAVRWESEAGGPREPDDVRYGVVVNPLEDDDEDIVYVSAYQANEDWDGWEPTEADPLRMNVDNLERIGGDGVASLPPVSQVIEQDAGLIDRLASRVASMLNVPDAEVEQHAVTITTPDFSGTEQNSWERPTFEDFGEDWDAARASATIDRSESGEQNFSDLGLFVVSPSSGNLNLAALRAANSRAPQTEDITEDQVSRLQTMYARLANEEFGVDWSESEQDASQGQQTHSDGDEPAESGTGDDPDTNSNIMEDENDDLREQLATVKSEKESLADEKEQLAEQNERRGDELDAIREQLAAADADFGFDPEETEQLSRVVEELVAEREQMAEQVSELETEVAPLKEMLAEIAAGDSMLNPQKIAETHSTRELVDMLADDEDDEDSDYTQKVKEQLAATVQPRGDAGGSNSPDDDLDEQQAAEVEQLAESVMTARDWKKSQDYSSNREYIRTTKGVDPATASSEEELRQRIQNNGAADGGEQ